MKKIILSCLLCSLMIFTLIGCSGIHISFDSDNNKSAQADTKQKQSTANKSTASNNKETEGKTKQDGNTQPAQTENKTNVIIIKEREAPQAPAYNGSFVFPDSDCTYLTENQVASLSNYQLGIARNEIYARHGYIFSTQKYITYFNSQSWYSPITKNVTLNSIEDYNVRLIKAEESRRGIGN